MSQSPGDEMDRRFTGLPTKSPQGTLCHLGKGRSGASLPQPDSSGVDGLQQEGPPGWAHCWAVHRPDTGAFPGLCYPLLGWQPLVPARERSCSLSHSYSPLNKALQEREGIISFLKGQLNPL